LKALVSVIVPAYNAAAYIRQTLQSVLAQSYSAIEVIVVDDGSTDATSTIVKDFVRADSRFQLIRQSNAGVGAARNAGIRKARGKYIAPLDADDLWFPEKLEKQVARMEECGSDTGLVYCWSKCIDEHGEVVGYSNPQTAEGRLRHALVLRNISDNASVPLFRAAALEKVGGYLTRAEQGGAQGCEDWDLHLRVAECFSVRVVPEHLVGYRQTNSGMSVRSEGMAKSFTVFLSRARQRNRDLPSDTFRWSAGYFYSYLAGKCYFWGHHSSCLYYSKEAVRANPIAFLNIWLYKPFVKSLFNVIKGSTANHLDSTEPKAKRLCSEPKAKRQFISNAIFERIQLARWSAALQDGAD
jgi:glycosyltransferase involved in cell wall biosynthesis